MRLPPPPGAWRRTAGPWPGSLPALQSPRPSAGSAQRTSGLLKKLPWASAGLAFRRTHKTWQAGFLKAFDHRKEWGRPGSLCPPQKPSLWLGDETLGMAHISLSPGCRDTPQRHSGEAGGTHRARPCPPQQQHRAVLTWFSKMSSKMYRYHMRALFGKVDGISKIPTFSCLGFFPAN